MKKLSAIMLALLVAISHAGYSFAKGAAPQATIIELPNKIKWLKDKRIFCDTKLRFLAVTTKRRTAERVILNALTQSEKIDRYFGVNGLPGIPVMILVADNNSEFKRISRQNKFQGLSVAIPSNGREERFIILPDTETGMKDVLPHELTHFRVMDISNSQGRKPDFRHPVPLCINEGIAELFTSEPQKKNIREFSYRAILKGGSVPLEKLLKTQGYSSDPKKLAAFYCDSFSLVSYILTTPQGKERLIKYLRAFDYTREDPYELFKEVFCAGTSSDVFKKGLTKYVFLNYAGARPKAAKKKASRQIARSSPASKNAKIRKAG